MCCGQKRQALSRSPQEAPAAAPRTAGAAAAVPVSVPRDAGGGPGVTLVSRDGSITSITGRVTGKRYQFHGMGGMQVVDRRDADAMIATGAFERVWG